MSPPLESPDPANFCSPRRSLRLAHSRPNPAFPPRTRGPRQEVRGGEGSAGPGWWMGSRCEQERHVGCAWTVVAGETCIGWRLLYISTCVACLPRRLWAWRAGATYLGWLFDWNLHIYTILTRVIQVDPRTVSWSPRKRFRAIHPKTE